MEEKERQDEREREKNSLGERQNGVGCWGPFNQNEYRMRHIPKFKHNSHTSTHFRHKLNQIFNPI